MNAGLNAYKSIKTIAVGGDIDSDAITISGTGKGNLNKLTALGNVDVTNLDVDGAIKTLTVGTDGTTTQLRGTISADTMINNLNVFGDIYADITAGTKLNSVIAGGDLKKDASINCTTGDINKVLISDTIYGAISAGNGNGRVKQVLRHQNTFVNAITGINNLITDHISADLTKTKWTSA
jgi:hypothetical protein